VRRPAQLCPFHRGDRRLLWAHHLFLDTLRGPPPCRRLADPGALQGTVTPRHRAQGVMQSLVRIHACMQTLGPGRWTRAAQQGRQHDHARLEDFRPKQPAWRNDSWLGARGCRRSAVVGSLLLFCQADIDPLWWGSLWWSCTKTRPVTFELSCSCSLTYVRSNMPCHALHAGAAPPWLDSCACGTG
jgi:hypothetical protein